MPLHPIVCDKMDGNTRARKRTVAKRRPCLVIFSMLLIVIHVLPSASASDRPAASWGPRHHVVQAITYVRSRRFQEREPPYPPPPFSLVSTQQHSRRLKSKGEPPAGGRVECPQRTKIGRKRRAVSWSPGTSLGVWPTGAKRRVLRPAALPLEKGTKETGTAACSTSGGAEAQAGPSWAWRPAGVPMNEAFAARPPKRSELTAGAIQLRGLAQTLDQARTGGLAEHDESLGRAAADALLPLGTVFEVVLPDRSSCFVRRGRFLGSGGTAFVCAVEFLTGRAGPVHSEVAAKFLYKQVSGGIDLSAAERTLATNFFQELDAHRTLTALRSVEELHTMGLGVAHGAYPLRRSQSSPDVRTTEVMFQGQTALVVMPLTMLVLPLLGPDLFDLYFEQVSPAVLKSLVFQTVHTVANLHSLGYGHGDLKPENFAVDIRSGAIKLIDFSSLAPLNVRRKISGQWTQTFASPEKFRALCARAPFAIADTDDAWSLGVALYRILSHLPHPYVSEVDLPAFEAQGLLGAEHRLDEFIMPQPWKERLTAIETRQELLQIVKLLVHPEPTRRWTPRRLVREHPFFQEQKEN